MASGDEGAHREVWVLRVTLSLQIRSGKGGRQSSATWARSLLSILENERCNGRESALKPGID